MIHVGSKNIFRKKKIFLKHTIFLSIVYLCLNRQCQQKKNGKFSSNGSRVIKIPVHEFFWCTLYVHIKVKTAVTLEPFVRISCVIARSKGLDEPYLVAGGKVGQSSVIWTRWPKIFSMFKRRYLGNGLT